MSNKRGRHHKRGGRTTPKGTRPLRLVDSGPPRRHAVTPEPIDLVARALAADGPLPLLALVSALLWSLRPEAPDRPTDMPPIDELVAAWADVDERTTTALLAVTAQLAAGPELRAHASRAVADRRQPLPTWLSRLDDTAVIRCVMVSHVLGDGDVHLVELRLADGATITIDVYVDHNLGTAVKSAFAVSEPIDELMASMTSLADANTTILDADPADTRARLEEALANPLSLGFFVDDDETWPRSRPLLEWALRSMPAGGTGHLRSRWTAKERNALVERFFASPWGRPQRDRHRRRLLSELLDLLDDDFETDITRWSPAVVSTLVERIVDQSDLDTDDLRATPDLLRAFVGYCHGERAIRAELTEDTLAVVDHLAYELLRHAADISDDEEDWSLPSATERYFVRSLVEEVGGEEALKALDDEPLPDDPFDWTSVDPEIHDQVATILRIVEEKCEQHFDLELRTAARRLVARAAKGDPTVFARARKPETAAAALVWIVAMANDAFVRHGLLVRDFMAGLGLSASSPSQRAEVFLRAARLEPRTYGRLTVGDVRLLTSAHRQTLIERRDRHQARIDALDLQADPR